MLSIKYYNIYDAQVAIILYPEYIYEEVDLETNNKAVLEDVGQNADLYIANQEDNAQN